MGVCRLCVLATALAALVAAVGSVSTTPSRFIVTADAHVSAAEVARSLARTGLEVERTLRLVGVVIVRGPASTCAMAAGVRGVRHCEADSRVVAL